MQKIFPGNAIYFYSEKSLWNSNDGFIYKSSGPLLYGIDGWCLIKVSNTKRYGQLIPILFFFSIFSIDIMICRLVYRYIFVQ